jgi:hypothetical protein
MCTERPDHSNQLTMQRWPPPPPPTHTLRQPHYRTHRRTTNQGTERTLVHQRQHRRWPLARGRTYTRWAAGGTCTWWPQRARWWGVRRSTGCGPQACTLRRRRWRMGRPGAGTYGAHATQSCEKHVRHTHARTHTHTHTHTRTHTRTHTHTYTYKYTYTRTHITYSHTHKNTRYSRSAHPLHPPPPPTHPP